MPIFGNISREDFKLLINYLIDINHVQLTEKGNVILGLTGEKVVGKFQFYAVFSDAREYAVKQGNTDIGSISTPIPVGNVFALAGRTWEVTEVDFKKDCFGKTGRRSIKYLLAWG